MENATAQPGLAPIFTIGHSHHSIEHFLDLLKEHGIDVLADVRSTPKSRFAPHFNRDQLELTLKVAGVRYAFMGEVLGGRPASEDCWENDRVSYLKLIQHAQFKEGIERVLVGSRNGLKVAMMCAERDPLDCHRSLAIARSLGTQGVDVQHIHSDGAIETQAQLEGIRLLKKYGFEPGPSLFESASDQIAMAYALHEEKISYRRSYASETAD